MGTKEQHRCELLQRIRAEFLEMPGLRLSRMQAQRLWALDEETCTDVIDALVGAAFLTYSADGRYMRASDGSIPIGEKARMIKADIAFEPRRRAKRIVTRR